MGFSSFITQNTNRSVANCHSKLSTFTVVMVDNNNKHYIEHNYQGYCDFGGKNYHVLLAQMNGVVIKDIHDDTEIEKARVQGIYMDEKLGDKCLFPNIYEVIEGEPIPLWKNVEPKSCPDQGYFY